jgi:Fusaric acid resistance protein-like
LRTTVRSLFALNDGPWRWAVGRDAGLAMGLPLVVFALAGQQQLGLIASLGAFTALYAAQLRRIDRLSVLPFVMIGFVIAAFIGVLASTDTTLSVVALIAVTIIGCVLSIGFELGPPGALLYVLVTGVTSQVAASMREAGSGDIYSIPLLVASGAALAYLVVIAPLAVPAVRKREGPIAGLRRLFPRFRLDVTARLIAGRIIAAAIIAGALSSPLHTRRTYWVIITAIAVLQASHIRRITWLRAVHRVVGTALGIGAFALLSMAQPEGYVLIAVIVLLQAAMKSSSCATTGLHSYSSHRSHSRLRRLRTLKTH